MSKVLVIVGMSGAGKSLAVDYIKKKNIPSVYFGGIIVDETIRRYGAAIQAKERIVREELRAKEGKAAVAALIIPKITALHQRHNWVIADGLYSWAEYKLFKETYGDNAIVIAVTAPRATRHERLLHRPVRPLTAQESQDRDYAEIEFIEKGGPIANADYTVINDTLIEKLHEQLEQILHKVSFYSK